MENLQNWKANDGPQDVALQLPATTFEILYGGARGGGKTDAGLVWIGKPQNNPKYRALVIRRNADDLADWVDRARTMYPEANVAYRPAVITFPSGAIIRTGHLKDDNAYGKYQGQEYHRILIEELTQIPNEKRYMQLISSCRSTVPDLKPQIFATTNPGGVGHGWVKERFIDFSPPFVRKKDAISGRLRVFIPAKIDDNPKLMAADPNYVHLMDSLKKTDEDLWKAWRLGDWDIFAGQAFREFRQDIHVINPSEGYNFDWPLDACKRFLTFDWGYSAPGCALWMAITPENKFGIRRVYVYRELYQNGKHPEEWAKELKAINAVDPVRIMYLPHDCFNKESGDSIAETFRRVGELRIAAGKTMVPGARLNRVALTHKALSIADDGKPYLQIHPNCKDLIRSLPSLVYDENKVEDIDTEGDDHAYDAMSLGLLMEAKEFGQSGGIRPAPAKGKFRTTFTPTSDGRLQAPNFWDEAKKTKKPSGRIY